MIVRKTKKRQKVDKDGNITDEKFTSTVAFLGITLKKYDHDYECTGDIRKNAVGFLKKTDYE